jgi:AbrB family looped-hinge helix DNA binding protein
METVKLSTKFQVVIPRAIRDELKLRAGEELRVIQHDGRVQLIPVRPIEDLRGMFKGIDTDIERESDRL